MIYVPVIGKYMRGSKNISGYFCKTPESWMLLLWVLNWFGSILLTDVSTHAECADIPMPIHFNTLRIQWIHFNKLRIQRIHFNTSMCRYTLPDTLQHTKRIQCKGVYSEMWSAAHIKRYPTALPCRRGIASKSEDNFRNDSLAFYRLHPGIPHCTAGSARQLGGNLENKH